ncbi:hypothetical protein [Arthronema virus TR020]|uniref:Uncharacterized protein n=1 Tax=Arthronema virus TR020 TaxID=2736280 RepID=A0A7G3WH18_9CAUD|nr:hypothetical protein [Arthronema virus TR020]
MIKFRVTVFHEPIIDGMDRALEVVSSVNPLSISSLKLALFLVDDHTKSLTIPENDGKVFYVALTRSEWGVQVEVTEDDSN